MKKRTYPNVIYVQRESDKDTEWLAAFDSPEDVAVVGESVRVAEYQLVRVLHVTAPAIIKEPR